ncbi:hypothetical protein M0R72_00975 [Candidatus Pacearchaeota archaeon]|jgi:hypothetical protein|nr:hypothetical protein [Candidatus Pacearchaeota archaeon]
MTRETASIQNFLISAEQSIPNLDGHKIRVAERRILWSKLAQQAPASAGAQPPRTYEEWEKQQKYKTPISNQQLMDQQAWQQANPEDELGKLLRPQGPRPPQQGVAHAPTQQVRRPAPKPKPVAPAANPVVTPVPKFDLRQTMDSPTGILPPQTYTPGPGDVNYEDDEKSLGYTPGPNDPNYTGASKSISGLLKIADYLSKKRTS